ncbi:hypothetical protein PENSPDRAFT_104490 [Peniophora sp. CONT]|nr:hypothetical protein PENSPDRAFT_104490 [Peniophora sp. CONT]
MAFVMSLRAISLRACPRLSAASFLLANRHLSRGLQLLSAHRRFISTAPSPQLEIPRKTFRRQSARTAKHPRGKSCSTCGTQETTCNWYNNPGEMGAVLCRNCYQRMKRRLDNLTGKACLDSSLCDHCYRIRRLERDKVRGRTCGDCGTKDTSFGWYRHPDDEAISLCQTCQHIRKKAYDLMVGRTCCECDRTETSHWHLHPRGDGTSLCDPCYYRHVYKPAANNGRRCRECDRESSSRWYGHPSNANRGDAHWCDTCYRRNYRAKKRAAKLAATEDTPLG